MDFFYYPFFGGGGMLWFTSIFESNLLNIECLFDSLFSTWLHDSNPVYGWLFGIGIWLFIMLLFQTEWVVCVCYPQAFCLPAFWRQPCEQCSSLYLSTLSLDWSIYMKSFPWIRALWSLLSFYLFFASNSVNLLYVV